MLGEKMGTTQLFAHGLAVLWAFADFATGEGSARVTTNLFLVFALAAGDISCSRRREEKRRERNCRLREKQVTMNVFRCLRVTASSSSALLQPRMSGSIAPRYAFPFSLSSNSKKKITNSSSPQTIPIAIPSNIPSYTPPTHAPLHLLLALDAPPTRRLVSLPPHKPRNARPRRQNLGTPCAGQHTDPVRTA